MISRRTERGTLGPLPGADVGAVARSLLADGTATHPAAELIPLGGATVIVATSAAAEANARLVPGLAPRGTLVLARTGVEPLQFLDADLVVPQRHLDGSLTGSSADGEDIQRVRPTATKYSDSPPPLLRTRT
jgi:D-arabinose 1-dehydrogenase-like Zn-dependent alcohol dehydrogenase